jgi:large subunit ribosomal protein L25
MRSGSAENMIIDLLITTDAGTDTRKVILKDLALDPLGALVHADFYEISMDKKITVNIPVQLINIPSGVTDGGILQHIRRQLSVTCLPDNLISFLELDVSGMDIGDSLHISDIHFPEGVNCDEEEHLTVAVVAAPTIVEEPEEEDEETGEEGEEEAVSDEEKSSEEVKD